MKPAAMQRAGLLALALLLAGCDSKPEIPVLSVSAGKDSGGLSLTNREGFVVEDCAVKLLERGGNGEFLAFVPKLAPVETVRIRWSDFTLSGQPMPAYIGQAAKHFTVSCKCPEPRQGAGLAFSGR